MIPQLIANGLISAGIYMIIAIGFLLIYSTVRFLHLAHAIVFTFGAYFALTFSFQLGLPLYVSIGLAVLACTLLGCTLELVIYRPIRRKGGSPMILLLASLGIYIVLQNIISVFFGDDLKTLPGLTVSKVFELGSIRITSIQLAIILTSIIIVGLVLLLTKTTKIGKAMRAVTSDKELAEVSGINSNAIVLVCFAVGSALAGLAGILAAMDTAMTPDMGLNVFLMAAAALIIGGVESIPGIAFGALLVGLTQHFGAWILGSQWQDAIAFAIIILFLVLRPHGLLGRRGVKVSI